MPICPQCGNDAGDNRFCGNCGADLSTPPPVESENLAPQPVQAAQPTQAPESQNSEAKQTNGKKKSGKGKIIAIVIGVFLVISIIGAAAGGSSDSSSSASSSSQSSASSSANAEAEDTSSEKTLLRSSLDANTGKDPSAYTEESFATLSAALENGEKIYADESATKSQVQSATREIDNAVSSLKEAFNPDNYQSIAYAEVARNPDSFTGERLVFSGKVLQVVEGSSEINLRIATDGGYDDVIFVGYDKNLLDFRVLEDDTVTVYGTCIGLYSYKSTMGATISLPGMYCEAVELQ